jgi:hypothetical protein
MRVDAGTTQGVTGQAGYAQQPLFALPKDQGRALDGLWFRSRRCGCRESRHRGHREDKGGQNSENQVHGGGLEQGLRQPGSRLSRQDKAIDNGTPPALIVLLCLFRVCVSFLGISVWLGFAAAAKPVLL